MRKTIDDVLKKLEAKYKVKPDKNKLIPFWQWCIRNHPEYNLNGQRGIKKAEFDVIGTNELCNKAMLYLYLTGEIGFTDSTGKEKRIGRYADGKKKKKQDRSKDLPCLSQKSIGIIYYRRNGNTIYECKPNDDRLYAVVRYLKRHGGWANNIDEVCKYKAVTEYFGRRIKFIKDIDLRFVDSQLV
jgi:hypothetical protein